MLRGIGQQIWTPHATLAHSPRHGDRGRIHKSCSVVRASGSLQEEEWSFNLARSRRRSEESPRTPVSGTSFAKPLSTLYPRLPCRFCKGVGEVACSICDGQGKFARGGYHKKNPVSMDHIVGSKWTAMERTFGWRHFRVHSKKRGSGKGWFVEMGATCDEATRFWVNFQNLKDRERWSMGWLQKTEILEANNKDAASNLVCKACKGGGREPCSCTLRDPDETILDIIEV